MDFVKNLNTKVPLFSNLANKAVKENIGKIFTQASGDDSSKQLSRSICLFNFDKILIDRRISLKKAKYRVPETSNIKNFEGKSGVDNDIAQVLNTNLDVTRRKSIVEKQQIEKITSNNKQKKVRFGSVLEPEKIEENGKIRYVTGYDGLKLGLDELDKRRKVERDELHKKLSPEELNILRSNEKFIARYKKSLYEKFEGREYSFPCEVVDALNVAEKETKVRVDKDIYFRKKLDSEVDTYIKEQNAKLINSFSEWIIEIYGSEKFFLEHHAREILKNIKEGNISIVNGIFRACGEIFFEKRDIDLFKNIKSWKGRSDFVIPLWIEWPLFKSLYPRLKSVTMQSSVVDRDKNKPQGMQLVQNTQLEEKNDAVISDNVLLKSKLDRMLLCFLTHLDTIFSVLFWLCFFCLMIFLANRPLFIRYKV